MLGSFRGASLDHETVSVSLSTTLTDATDGVSGNPLGLSFCGIVSIDLPVPISPSSEDIRTYLGGSSSV